jgi:hypothetical protein
VQPSAHPKAAIAWPPALMSPLPAWSYLAALRSPALARITRLRLGARSYWANLCVGLRRASAKRPGCRHSRPEAAPQQSDR